MFKFAQVIDPVVKTSLSEEGKPWILSPLVSSINILTAWRPRDADLPSPPITPRQSMDTARSLHGSGSSWGFLNKLKHGHHSSAASTSSNGSRDINDSRSSSANNSTERLEDHVHGTHHRVIEPSPLSSTPDSSRHVTGSTTSNSLDDSDMPLGHWRQSLEEDTTFFRPDKHSMSTSHRRSHFQSEEARRQFVFKPDLVHGFEFFSPYMNFNTGDVKLVLSLNVRKYLNDQPVRYTCRTLDGNTVFWAVQFEFVE